MYMYINVFIYMYKNHCPIRLKETEYPGFAMTSGVRQPLSPLLYALAADGVLEKIYTKLPGIWAREYADDTAAETFGSNHPCLQSFASISGLHLNYSKGVIIPLHPCGPSLTQTDKPKGCPRQPDVVTARCDHHRTAAATLQPERHEDPLSVLRRRLAETLPLWESMMLEWSGTYLGFVVGHLKADKTRSKPARRHADRCSLWRALDTAHSTQR